MRERIEKLAEHEQHVDRTNQTAKFYAHIPLHLLDVDDRNSLHWK